MGHTGHLPKVLLIISAILASEISSAAEKEDEPTLTVPNRLRGHGYRLRLPRHDESLDKPMVKLREDRTYDAELLDSAGVILARGRVSGDEPLSLYPRRLSLGINTGLVTPMSQSAWQKGLLPKHADESSLDLTYRLTKGWKGWLQWLRRFASRTLDDQLKLQYQVSILMVGGKREIAPWSGDATSPFRSIHLALLGAAGYSQSRVDLYDTYVGISRQSGSFAAALGAEIQIPLFDNAWGSIRHLGRIENINIESLNAKGILLLNAKTVGVSYDF